MPGSEGKGAPNERVLIVGDRGARNLWPDNSLDGFRRTRALGIDAVEFDVHLARDGELVVIHDPTLERTTLGTGAVADRTAAELAATKLRDGNGEGVPHFASVLDVFADSGMELHIEIKTDALGRPYPRLEQRLLDLLARRGLQHDSILLASYRRLESARRLSPAQRVLASLDRHSAEMLGGLVPALDRLTAIEGCMVAVEKGLLADGMDICLRRLAPSRLGVWVPNEAPELAAWLSRPLRQITTDRPDIALQERARLPTSLHSD
jgi:glycerophosphoryl diester phosphodiesterase